MSDESFTPNNKFDDKDTKEDVTPQTVSSTPSFSGLASGLVTSRSNSNVIKSGENTPGGNKPSSFKFIPNVNPSSGSNSASSSGRSTPTTKTKIEPLLDLGAALAQSLTFQNLKTGGARADINLMRGSAPSMGMRGCGASRTNYGSIEAKLLQNRQNIQKNKSGRKSRDVQELSWATGPGGAPMYTPISLPYVATTVEDAQDTNTQSQKSKRPTLKHIDEANRNVASLFTDRENEDPEWFLVQFPEILPALEHAIKAGSTNNQASSSDSAYIPSRLDGLPEGRLGTLELRRSGRVILKVGAHRFEVNQGSDCNFSQEVGCLMGDKSELMFLGRCQKRIVITPDIRHYLDSEK